MSPVEVSVWNLLTMKRFWFFIVLKLIADCSRVGLVIPKHYPHQDCLVFILTVGLPKHVQLFNSYYSAIVIW